MIEVIETWKNCNNSCIMCVHNTKLSSTYCPPTKKEIFEKIDHLKSNLEKIIISGGEPTLRKDFFDIIFYINTKYPGLPITIITNARLFYYKDFVDKLKKYNNISIISELHASNRLLHDYITKTEGSFDQSFKGIKNLLEEGFKLELRIVISKLNYKDLPNLAKLYLKEFKKTERFTIFPIDLIGNAFKYKSETLVSYSQMTPFLIKTLSILQNKKISLYHTPYCLIDKKYWGLIEWNTVKNSRLNFSSFCKKCKLYNQCPGLWKTYTKLIGFKELKCIKD